MTRNEKRFNVIGTIGNGEELIPVKPELLPCNCAQRPVKSFHAFREKNEVAIRYSRDKFDLHQPNAMIVVKSIFLQFPTEFAN